MDAKTPLISLFLLALAGAAPAFAGEVPAKAATAKAAPATTQPATEEGVTDFTLPNGLEVVVIPDHRAPVVTHMVWYKIGSADEVPGKSGIAHFLEHLMFKGTVKHPAGEFSGKVSEIGGQENAFTTADYTAYFQQVDPSVLETMMAFEADRMRNLVLTDAVIGPERDVILEERRMRIDGDPGSILNEEVNATLYQNHHYGIPVIGWLHEMETLDRKDATDWYSRYYAPNNAVLIVAGDVTAKTVRDDVEKTYALVPRGPDLPPRIRPQEPEQNTTRTVTLTDARVSLPSFQKLWVVPSYHSDKGKGEAEALDLLSEVLGGGVRSRLYQALVVKAGIASSAGASYDGDALDPSSFSVFGSPVGAAKLEDVEKAVDAEISKIAREGVTPVELDKAKNRYVKSMIFARDNQSGMARIYGSTLAVGGSIKDVQDWPDRIRAVTPDQVKAAAAKYIDNKRSVTGYLLPEETRG